MAHVTLTWKGGMEFDAQVGEHKIVLDADESVGGANVGPGPKPLLLVALGACTGMDVTSLARKMRVVFERIEITADAEQSREQPWAYTSMTLKYYFEGQGIDPEKPLKMVRLSQERYCGVSFMLRAAAPLRYEVYLNGDRIDKQTDDDPTLSVHPV